MERLLGRARPRPGRRHRARSRRLLDAARRGRARLFVPRRRPARHAHGPRRRERRRPGRTAFRRRARRPHPHLGEERFARRVARAIVAARAGADHAAPASWPRSCAPRCRRASPGIDPATRTFQALRIAVNDELGELDRGLAAAERLLMPGGRLAVVVVPFARGPRVKNFLRQRSDAAPRGSRHLPAARRRGPAPSFRLLTRRPIAARRRRDRAQPARPLGPAARRRAHRGAAGPRARRRAHDPARRRCFWLVLVAATGYRHVQGQIRRCRTSRTSSTRVRQGRSSPSSRRSTC